MEIKNVKKKLVSVWVDSKGRIRETILFTHDPVEVEIEIKDKDDKSKV
jgi:hypothetical protein